MATVPLQAAFRGDFVTLLVFVEETDTMDIVAQKVAHHVIDRRLPPENLRMRVRYNQQVLSPDQTVAQAGILPMNFVEVFYDADVRSRVGMGRGRYPGQSLGR